MNSLNGFPRFKKILVPLDGSPIAEEAISMAATIVCASRAELLLLRVILPSGYVPLHPMAPVGLAESMRETAFTNARDYLQHVIAYANLETLKVQSDVLQGGAATTIVDYAVLQGVDLIVMRTHGETGLTRWIMGSTAQQLVRNSPVPVLVIPKLHDQPITFRPAPRALIALDGSPIAEEAILPAAQLIATLAQPGRGAIHLTRVVQHFTSFGRQTKAQIEQLNKEQRAEGEAYLKNIKQRILKEELAPPNMKITSSVVTYTDVDDITKRILEESACVGEPPEFTGCTLIAMSTHGRHGFQHLLLGSFTEDVLGMTDKPLLVVHSSKSLEGPQKKTAKKEKINVPIL
ncbi:universal stress protein UspA [Dictyobacter alpinus]|uniref:Universal stress protein UspA n=1 Tax=Dictyobacter alpinus TaxID=2014873 RepID=A0A402BFF3_9CHLR|nr:universal stress protein [Dictyobacter alpinus]GCE30141.1 universal stress protein UspA [Dictyobacter alpinus]